MSAHQPDTHSPGGNSPELNALLREVRSTSPRIDWSRVEARLFDASGEVRSIEPSNKSRLPAYVTAFAAAAAFVVALTAPGRPIASQATSAVRSFEPPPVQLISAGARALAIGEYVVAPMPDGAWVRIEGRLTAHLSGGTRARLLDNGERIHFALETGSIAANVVPVAGGEPFAVDVGTRRVAVHGTQLSIARDTASDAVDVVVAEGSAVVGLARGKGRTEGTVVPAGAMGRFGDESATVEFNPDVARERVRNALATSTAGASARVADAHGASPHAPLGNDGTAARAPNRVRPPRVNSEADVTSTTTPTDSAPDAEDTAPATTAAGVGTTGLTAAEVAPSLRKVDAALRGCVPRTSAGVKLTIESTMRIVVTEGGALEPIQETSFDPPLSSQLRECIRGALAKITFPPSDKGPTTIRRAVVLGGE